jgi:ribonuclease T2
MTRACVFALAILLLPLDASAFEKLQGWFIAFERCEAMQSKNRGTNPGEVMTEARRAYEMIGINKKGGDHYQLRVPGAPVTEERWVRADCGVHVVAAGTAPLPDRPGPGPVTEGPRPGETPEPNPEPGPGSDLESDDNLLALSWQPAFCETKPDKSECRRLNAGGLPATERQLSVHGLWPQPRGNEYCGVADELARLDAAGRWSELPEAETDAETRAALEAAMPGTASFLERHEWIKHGTCHLGAGGADEYFDDALRLTAELNGSPVGRFLAENLGREVRTDEIAALFDEAFGEGAGDRVEFACARDGGRALIGEIRIALRGVIGPETGLGELMLGARPVGRGCARGVIDPAGLQ